MAQKSYSERLENVQTAIESILLGGQSYTIDGQTFNRGDLAKLFELEKWYESKVDGASFPKFVPIGFKRCR